jgi:putative FmdB family regulatory protein
LTLYIAIIIVQDYANYWVVKTQICRRVKMPIFEFRCLECGDLFEKLFLNNDERVDIGCPECGSGSCERVVSRTNYTIGVGPGGNQAKITTKSCSSGNECTTLDLPGPSK